MRRQLSSRDGRRSILLPMARMVLCLLVGFAFGNNLLSLRTTTGDAFERLLLTSSAGQTSDIPDSRRRPSESGGTEDLNRTKASPGGYTSPVASMSNHFPNEALGREASKHDRMVVDSVAYLNTFDSAANYTKSPKGSSPPKTITIVVLTINRAVPYIAVLLATLLRGHEPAVFSERFEVRVANIERRPGREDYHLFKSLREKLPFVKFVDWTGKYPDHAKFVNNKNVLYMEDQREDYIRALVECKLSGSKWCVVMEDDAVPCVDFATKFDTFVNKERYTYETVDEFNNETKLTTVGIDKVAMVKLYVPYNDNFLAGGARDLRNDEYSRAGYEKDRAHDLSESEATGTLVEKVRYRIQPTLSYYGAVANAYPSKKLDMLIWFLKKTNRGKGVPTDTTLTYGLFLAKTGLTLLETDPSLVNHIGYYSENRDAGRVIGKVSTDVRFQLDDGPRSSIVSAG